MSGRRPARAKPRWRATALGTILVAATLTGAACGSGGDAGDDLTGGPASGNGAAPTLGAEPLAAPLATVIGDSGSGPGDGTGPVTGGGAGSTTTTAPVPVDPTAALIAELDARPLPADPATLAAELSETEAALGDATLALPVAQARGRRQQLLYRVLSANPEWAGEVVGAVDPAVQEIVGLNWEARSNLSALVRSEDVAPTLPAWEIRAPLPPDELLGYYREAAAATGVPWEVLAAINLVETRMGRISGLSTAGAVGPMQFLPTTWAECCTGDPTVDRDAILGAARYLVDRGGPDDLDRAIFGYNNSDRYVRAVQAYAGVLALAPHRYYGFHAWEVVFLSTAGLVRLPEGYRQPEPVDAAAWLAANPTALVTGAT